MGLKIINNREATMHTEEAVYRYLESFGKVTSAKMTSNPYKLVLKNNKGDEMEITESFSAGYRGEGSKATCKLLKKCGFDFEDELVFTKESFELRNRR